MLLGYNTNGLAHHDLLDAVRLVAEIGYRSVAITIDHHALPPGREWTARQTREVKGLLRDFGMRSAIETGARFLLDPRVKHEPTLMSVDAGGRARRIALYRHAIDLAAELGSDCVSIWSGVPRDEIEEETAMRRLVEGLTEVAEYGAGQGVAIGLEPEPGMFIDTMARYAALLGRFDADSLRLTLDVGHLHCQGEVPLEDHIRRWAGQTVNVHLEDMVAGRHEHLMFGEGQIDFVPVLRAFSDAGYAGALHVELSRHSHEGPTAARRAHEFLRPLIDEVRVTTETGDS